jgi:hypothetical protein
MDPLTLLFAAIGCFVLSIRTNSFSLAGIAVGLFFWSGVMYSIA